MYFLSPDNVQTIKNKPKSTPEYTWALRYVDGVAEWYERPWSESELVKREQKRLDKVGASMTLLVVLGLIPIEDAANALHLEEEDLVREAQAWAIVSQSGSAKEQENE
jgi:hypothetical protein